MKQRKITGSVLALGALGVVFGDIGTSPLYTLQAIFGLEHAPLTAVNIVGAVSLVIWAVTIVVALKYVTLIMCADNAGEGGILALVGLLRAKMKTLKGRLSSWLLLGFAGLALFYGDSVITPAISVLSAVEGTRVAWSQIATYIVPITAVVLAGLFVIQSRGTGLIGRFFGPIMVVWFIASGVAGLGHVIGTPEVLWALSPLTALQYAVVHPGVTFVLLSAVVLAVTGAEALYADMGHFGRSAVRRAWFWLVFPALLLNYLGQGALVLGSHSAIASPYFLLYPSVFRLPAMILATLATLIASQAVIAGAFSLTRQAVRLGFLPPMLVRHTSEEESGQVYIGIVNWIIFVLVLVLVVTFGSSERLAGAYGMAVSGTLLIDSLLFFTVAHIVRGWSVTKVCLIGVWFVIIDTLFFVSSLQKIIHGGWIPLLIATVTLVLMVTWTRGRQIVSHERQIIEGTLDDFVSLLHTEKNLARPTGSAIYLAHHGGMTPLALRASIDQLHELLQTVVIVNVHTLDVPHVPLHSRARIDELGYDDDGITYVHLEFGYNDIPNVPLALEHLLGRTPELEFDLAQSTYFISDSDIAIMKNHRMSRLLKYVYVWMARNATKTTTYFRLPPDRTIDMASYIEL
ncbi:MAG TPA: KUP/HAK/KT family potassium transporter [Candidatus Saccharimonadaceae bacterium]|nr:KUP/HAK/KT family potassium transporter [Candidatus Saccharimonadaceae bacterium]